MARRRALTWRPRYLAVSLALLAVLVYIAVDVRDAFVRPFLGDVLAVAWVYVTARVVLELPRHVVAAGALALACLLELGQYFELVTRLGLEEHALARTLLGATFDVLDLLAYALGWALVLGVERVKDHLQGA